VRILQCIMRLLKNAKFHCEVDKKLINSTRIKIITFAFLYEVNICNSCCESIGHLLKFLLQCAE